MASKITMGDAAPVNSRRNVYQGRRLIGFIMSFSLRGVSGWRFLPNREEIAAIMPAPPTVHATADDALAAAARRIAEKIQMGAN